MKRFKRWFTENWKNRSFRYAVTVMVMIVLAILTNIYVYFRDRAEVLPNDETENTAFYTESGV